MLSKIRHALGPARTGALAVAALLALLTTSCAGLLQGAPKGPAVLSPEGANVEFAMSTPSGKIAKLLGTIDVESEGKEVGDAEQAARAELRNKAGSMGATLVTIDNNIGQRVLFGEGVKVTLVGRAFRAVD